MAKQPLDTRAAAIEGGPVSECPARDAARDINGLHVNHAKAGVQSLALA